jgi:hypothetical protein
MQGGAAVQEFPKSGTTGAALALAAEKLYMSSRVSPHGVLDAGAADMTLQDVSNVYNQVVREMSLNLVLHEAALQQAATAAGGDLQWPPADLKPWQNIRTAFDRWVLGET